MEVLQKSLDDVLASLKGFGDKLDAVAAEVKTNGGEVVRLTKQVDDFGADLDHVRRRQLLADKAKHAEGTTPETRPAGASSSAPPQHAVLANNGRPLLPDLPRPRTEEQHHQGHASGVEPQGESHGFHAKPPKHNFPKFTGENPLLWIDLAYTYFDMYSVQHHQWLSTATLYLEDHAALWFQAYKRRHPSPSWDQFVAAVIEEFGQDEFDGQMSKLVQLKQTGTVLEYKLAFESCMYHLIALDASLSPQFVFGLRDKLRVAVRLQAPSSVTRAASLARIQEEEAEYLRPRGQPAAPTKHPPAPPLLLAGSSSFSAPRVDPPR